MLGLDVNIRSMEKDGRFVKWVGLSIIWLCLVDVMISSSFPILSRGLGLDLISPDFNTPHTTNVLPLCDQEIG